MRSEAIEALLRACDEMGHEHLCAHIVGCNCDCKVRELDQCAVAMRAELAREPVELSDEELSRTYAIAASSVHAGNSGELAVQHRVGLRAVARAARGEK